MRLRIPVLLLAAHGLVPSAGALTAQVSEVSDFYLPGDEGYWIFEQGGEEIGHCWSRYEGEVDLGGLRAHAFRGQVLLSTPTPSGTVEQRQTAELWTDAAGRPLRSRLQISILDVYSSVDLNFRASPPTALIRQGPAERTLEVDVADGSHVLANNFVSHLELLLTLAAPELGESVRYPMFSSNTLQGFELRVEHVADLEQQQGESVSLYQDSLGEALRVGRDGRLLAVEIPAQKITITRIAGQPSLFTLAPPESESARPEMEEEEVRIEHGEVSLAGTITRPPGARGRLPAIFFLSGSGAQDRNGFSNGVDVGTAEILDRLTVEGFLVLRVDDRGTGGSRGPTQDMTFDDLVEDARQCLLFLKERGDVDPARIALIGHSEGGQTAPILAVEHPDVAAIVLMAGPGRTIPELTAEQLLRGAQREGRSPEELEELAVEIEELFEAMLGEQPIASGQVPAELRFLLAGRAWFRSHARRDPVATLRKVRAPVLLLQGARDIQVSVERDAERLLAALEEAGHEDHELVVFPELDHLFKKTLGEESSGTDYLVDRPVDSEFLDRLAAWLKRRLWSEAD